MTAQGGALRSAWLRAPPQNRRAIFPMCYGSAYIAKETAQTAAALGLRLLFTPVRSPQSNGIAEAFVKTLKCDYARLAILTDAEAVMRLLPAWFEDYNTFQPHYGLRMLSPREYLSRTA